MYETELLNQIYQPIWFTHEMGQVHLIDSPVDTVVDGYSNEQLTNLLAILRWCDLERTKLQTSFLW